MAAKIIYIYTLKGVIIKKWKQIFSWLKITETKKLVCVICSSPQVNLTFITGGKTKSVCITVEKIRPNCALS